MNKIYTVSWTPTGKKMLKKIPKHIADKMTEKINNYLALDPWGKGKRLDGDWEGYWSFRYWPYRVIYQILDKEVSIIIFEVWHRKEDY